MSESEQTLSSTVTLPTKSDQLDPHTEYTTAPLIEPPSDTTLAVLEENSNLKQHVARLETRILALELDSPTITHQYPPQTLELRQITDQEACTEMQQLFKNTDVPLYYSDISQQLQLDLEQVVRVCDELYQTGQIFVDEAD